MPERSIECPGNHMERACKLNIKAHYITGWGGFRDALYIFKFEIMILLRVKAKSLLCYWTARGLGIGMAQIARCLNLSLAWVSQSVKRGEKIVQPIVLRVHQD